MQTGRIEKINTGRQFTQFFLRCYRLPDSVVRIVLEKANWLFSLYGFYDYFNLRWLHLLAYLWRFDQWQRYTSVVEKIKNYGPFPISVLDVGGARGG